MALDTYSGLKTAIADLLDRDDLTDNIDDFIDLAEAMHKRDIRIRDMITRDTLTIDDRYVDLPSDYLEAISIRILTDADGNYLGDVVLNEVNLDQLNYLRINDNNQQRPKNFAIHTQIEFDTDADQSYGGEIIYYAELTALDDDNTSNAILTRAPEAYLYGSLIHAAPFLMHDERIKLWSDLYAAARDTLRKSDRRSRHSGPLVSRVAGTVP